MYVIIALKWRAYIALEFLAFFGMFNGQIIRHLGEFESVCLLTVLSLKDKSALQWINIVSKCAKSLNAKTDTHRDKQSNITDITEQVSSLLGLGYVQTSFSFPAHSFHPVQVWAILVLWNIKYVSLTRRNTKHLFEQQTLARPFLLSLTSLWREYAFLACWTLMSSGKTV